MATNQKKIVIVIDDVEISENYIMSIKPTQEIGVLPEALPIGTCVVELKDLGEYAELFSNKKKFQIYQNGDLKITSFVSSFKKSSFNQWSLQGEDYISVLEDAIWYGDEYTDVLATTLIDNVFKTAGVPYILETDVLDGVKLSGELGVVSCRDAALNICYATGVTLDTSNSDKVRVKTLPPLNNVSQKIAPERIYEGLTITENEKIENVSIVAYSKRNRTGTDPDEISGTRVTGVYEGQILEHYFTTPYNGYSMSYIDPSGVVHTTDNYVIIEQSLYHVKIRMTTTPSDERLIFYIKAWALSELHGTTHWYLDPIENSGLKPTTVDGATLVSRENVADVLVRTYNYLVDNEDISCKIARRNYLQDEGMYTYGEAKYGQIMYGQRKTTMVDDADIELGDVVEIEIPNVGVKTKRLVRQTWTMGHGIEAKECLFK